MARKKIIVLDFDGVIHSYKNPWRGANIIPDPPVEGAAEAIDNIRQHYMVYVYSARCHQPGGVEAIQDWLDEWEIEVDKVVKIKPTGASLFIDDRGLRFEGDWNEVIQFLNTPGAIDPWNKKKSKTRPPQVDYID